MMAEDPGYSLIRAVRDGNVQTAKQLIDNFGLSYSKAWSSGYNLLRDALQYEQEEVTKLLLKSGSKINSKSKRPSTTPLHFAVKNGYTDIVAMLLERHANVNAKDHSNETALHCAVERGSLEIVKLLMKKKAAIHAKSIHGTTALYLAVQKGNLAIVEELLNHGAQINNCTQSSRKNFMPLHCAAAQGNAAMVELLLRKSAEVNITSRDKRTPLHVAADMGQDKVVKLLLENGANVNTRDRNGKTVLHVAVAKAHLPTVEQILLFRPDIQSEGNRNILYTAINIPCCINMKKIVDALLRYGFTVCAEDAKDVKLLHTAVERGYVKVVDALIKFGADVNEHHTKKGVTLLHTAAFHYQREITELLLSNGANVNAKDNLGKSAICYAIENRDEEITKLLLSGTSGVKVTTDILHTAVKKECRNIVEILLQRAPNFDVNECDKLGRTALHHTVLNEGWDFSPIAFFPAKKGADNKDLFDARVEMAKMFLSRGARVNAKTKNGMTALHYAVEGGYVNVVQLLLKNTADVNFLAENRTTPLHSAAKGDNTVIVKMLLDSGANVNARQKNGTTALHIASKSGHQEVVKLLVERGAGLDTKSGNEKSTPLYFATVNGYSDVVETLLKLGANVEAKDKSGRTALHVAAKHGWPAVAEVLLNYGANINVTCMESMTPLNYATIGTKEYNHRHDEALWNRCFGDDYDDDDYFDHYPQDDDFFSDPDHDDFYDYFADDYESVSDCPCQEVAAILEQHIVTMKALDLYVSEKNLRAVDLQYEHRNMLEQCQMEIAKMKSKKIGDSSVSFHDILTRGMNQLAVYARNQSIIRVFESQDDFSEFPSYCGMIDRRFKQGQKRESLLSSSLKSLFALSGYVLPDLSAIELFNYLSNKDLENLIDADPNADKCHS